MQAAYFFSYRTGSTMNYFHVIENDILAIIKTLVPKGS